MNYADRVIHAQLLMDPTSVYITPNGASLYLLVSGGMMCLTGPDFNSMNEAEVNEFIQLVFKK